MGGEEVQNQTKMILDRLDAVDETLVGIRADHEQLRDLWRESSADRENIHTRLAAMDAEMEAERIRLVQEARMYREAMETRVAAVEARDTISEIKQAIAVQLALHRWWKPRRNKIIALVTPILTLAVAPNLAALVRYLIGAVLHRLGLPF
jgi:hypothetical protein